MATESFTTDYPEQSYFPSCKATLIIRFEEFNNSKTASGLPTSTILTKLKGLKDPNSGVTANQVSVGGIQRWSLDATPKTSVTSGAGQNSPAGPDQSADQLTQTIGGIIPSRCEVQLNGIRTANTASLEFRYLDMPFDPRIVRSCAVEVYYGVVTAEDFQAGQVGGVRTSGTGTGDPLNLVPDSWVNANGTKRSNLRFEGWVDEWEIDFDTDREPVVRLKCRDNTQLLIDTDAPPGLAISVTDPIDKAIAVYLSNFPSFAGLTVEYRGQTSPATPPILKGQLSKSSYNSQTGGPSAAKGGGASGKLAVWDYLTDIVGIVGHTIRLEGTNIIIQQVRTIVGSSAPARLDDPFAAQPTSANTTNTTGVRKFIYGRNLKSLKIARKFGRAAPKNIEVHCWSNHLKTTLVKRFPTTVLANGVPQSPNPLVTKAGDSNETVYQVIRIEGIEDRGTLKLIAQSTFEQYGRNELSNTLVTRNLASFGGGNVDPDVLDLIAGDTIDIQLSRDEAGDVGGQTTSNIDNLFKSIAMAQDFLTAVGYSAAFAKVAATATANANFQTRFKTKNISVLWDANGSGESGGITLTIQAVNYTEVRIDPFFQTAAPITVGAVTVTGSNAPGTQ